MAFNLPALLNEYWGDEDNEKILDSRRKVEVI
jgi:hypothetical protein